MLADSENPPLSYNCVLLLATHLLLSAFTFYQCFQKYKKERETEASFKGEVNFIWNNSFKHYK